MSMCKSPFSLVLLVNSPLLDRIKSGQFLGQKAGFKVLENEIIHLLLFQNICYLSAKPTPFGPHNLTKNFHLMSKELQYVPVKLVSFLFPVSSVTVRSTHLHLVDDKDPACRQLSTCGKPKIPKDCQKGYSNRKEGMRDSIISPNGGISICRAKSFTVLPQNRKPPAE